MPSPEQTPGISRKQFFKQIEKYIHRIFEYQPRQLDYPPLLWDAISRRQFIQRSLAGLGLSGLVLTESWPFIYARLTEILRSASLPRLDSIPDESIYFGSSPHNNDLEEIKRLAKALNHPVQIVNLFYSSINVPDRIIQTAKAIIKTGRIPMLSWGPTSQMVNRQDELWELTQFKANFKSMADALANIGGPVLYRPLYEFNGNWFGYNRNHQPQIFKDFWQWLFELFKDASNVQFVWCPNSTINAANFQPFWVESDYTHLIGLDVYDKFQYNRLNLVGHFLVPNVAGRYVIGPDLVALRQLTTDQDFVVAEINSSRDIGRSVSPNDPIDRAGWLKETVKYITSHMPGTIGIMSFDWYKNGIPGEIDWGPLRDPRLLAMWKQLLQRPYFKNNLPNQDLAKFSR